MRKIIFLDFDGVINGGFNKWEGGESGFDWSIPAAVDNLNSLLEKTNAKIVVSSSWRLKENWPEGTRRLKALTDQLIKFGLKENLIDVVGITREDLFDKEGFPAARAQEIRDWIDNFSQKEDSFVVIDDQDIFVDINFELFEDPFLRERFVRTEMKKGFTTKNLEKALEILNK